MFVAWYTALRLNTLTSTFIDEMLIAIGSRPEGTEPEINTITRLRTYDENPGNN